MPLSDNAVTLFAKGSTGTGRGQAQGFENTRRIMVEVQVEAQGATPSITYTIQGSFDGSTWFDIAYVDIDATVASTKAGITYSTVALTKIQKFIDGLDKRYFPFIAVNVSANTNTTFSARAYPYDTF